MNPRITRHDFIWLGVLSTIFIGFLLLMWYALSHAGSAAADAIIGNAKFSDGFEIRLLCEKQTCKDKIVEMTCGTSEDDDHCTITVTGRK